MNYIEIKKELIPYRFDIMLNEEVYEIRIDYNNFADLFIVTLSKNGVTLCLGEPIIYGVPLFSDLFNRGNFPLVSLCATALTPDTTAVTYDNLSSTVFLKVWNPNE